MARRGCCWISVYTCACVYGYVCPFRNPLLSTFMAFLIISPTPFGVSGAFSDCPPITLLSPSVGGNGSGYACCLCVGG